MTVLNAPIVIVGAGQAAARAAHALRANGHVGPVTMVGEERHLPYERPPLSKAVLLQDAEPLPAVLQPNEFQACRVDYRAGVRAQRLDRAARVLHLGDGRTLAYERCLIATGARARQLPALHSGSPRVHYLRTLDDAHRLRAALTPGARLAVIGGGFLGLEVAASALKHGVVVTVVESAPILLGRFLPPELSNWLEDRLRAQEVRLKLGCAIQSVAVTGQGVDLTLTTGEAFQADHVLVAIGAQPVNELAREAGLEIDAADGGIVVGPDGRTSDPYIFAAGDCTSQYRSCLGYRLRMESWQNANEQARAAAAGMLDRPADPQPFPWFWTDQGEHNLQILGLSEPGLRYARRGDPTTQAKAVWIGHRDGVPIHGIGLNAGVDLRALRPLFEQRAAFDVEAFISPSVPLRPWVKSTLAATAA